LDPTELADRAGTRTEDAATAAAHFELAQHLQRAGEPDAAIGHFKAAHRLHPENWTYKRQAWSLVHPLQGPTEQYDTDWLTEVRQVGAENYYPTLQM
jgi:tetratricopeptide (TPR) repeat protein